MLSNNINISNIMTTTTVLSLLLLFVEIWCRLLKMVNWLCGMDILQIRYANVLIRKVKLFASCSRDLEKFDVLQVALQMSLVNLFYLMTCI